MLTGGDDNRRPLPRSPNATAIASTHPTAVTSPGAARGGGGGSRTETVQPATGLTAKGGGGGGVMGGAHGAIPTVGTSSPLRHQFSVTRGHHPRTTTTAATTAATAVPAYSDAGGDVGGDGGANTSWQAVGQEAGEDVPVQTFYAPDDYSTVCRSNVTCVFVYDSMKCIDRNLCLQVCGSNVTCVFLYDPMSCIDQNVCLQGNTSAGEYRPSDFNGHNDRERHNNPMVINHTQKHAGLWKTQSLQASSNKEIPTSNIVSTMDRLTQFVGALTSRMENMEQHGGAF